MFCFAFRSICTIFAGNMVLNYIWIAFFIIAFVIALVKLVFLGDFDVFPAMMDSTFSSSEDRREGWHRECIGQGAESCLRETVPRHPQRASRHGLDLHEYRSQHARTG